MEIDWSKAPAGTTHYLPEDSIHLACWIRRNADETLSAMYADGLDISCKEWRWACGLSSREALLVPRPAPWNGEGLPPVGTVCEIRGTVGQELRRQEFSWRKVEIIAHTNFGGEDVAVGRDYEYATFGWGIASRFRPIRTPEQIAAQEREKAIETIRRDTDYILDDTCAAAVLAAGYRKTEAS